MGEHGYRSLICRECGHTHTIPIECGDRTCEFCQRRRRARICKRFEPIVAIMPHPYFITLTTKRKALTRHGVRKLRKDFQKLRDRKLWEGDKGVYQIETGTITDLNMCNLHIHSIVNWIGPTKILDIFHSLPSKLKRNHPIAKKWFEITGDSYIIDIKRCFSARQAIKGYLTKHMAKRVGTKLHMNVINAVFHNTRLIQGYGKLCHTCRRIWDVQCEGCGAVNSYVLDIDTGTIQTSIFACT